MAALVLAYPWISRSLAVVLATLVWFALPTVAGAAAPAEARCLAARALSGLTPAEQQRLATRCAGRGRPGPEDAPLLARLAARAGWEAAALGELLDGAAPHLDLGVSAPESKRLQAVRRALQDSLVERPGLAQKPGCKPVAAALDDYAAAREAGEPTVPPFAGAYLDDGRCVPLDAAALADINILTVPADAAESLFVAAAAGERVVLQWFGPSDAVAYKNRRVFVVAVPSWSVVTVRAAARDVTAATTWSGFVIHDLTLWDRPPAAGCLRLSVDLDADTALLLDGHVLTDGERLAHRTVGVVAGAHELVALRCAGGSECAVRFREVLPASAQTGTQNLCQDLALDLHQPRSVAILRVSAAPGCDAALAWRANGVATDYLRHHQSRTGRVFRDLASYATLTEALGAMRTSLNPAAGATVGASTGADSLELVATVAKEAWRQGIDELVSLELRCTAGDAPALTLQGSSISVREVFGRSRGDVAGLDLTQLLRLQSLEFRSDAQLQSTVEGVLDQLLGRSYLRIREGAASFPYRQRARVELTAFGQTAVDGTPELAAVHLAEPHRRAPQVCQALRQPDRGAALLTADALVRAAPRAQQMQVATGRDTPLVAPATEESDPLSTAAATYIDGSLRATRPGTYLVVARWRTAAGPGPVLDATCVRFEVPARELWASVMFAPDLTMVTPIRDYRAHHLRALLGQTWYTRRPWLGLGVAGGYAYTRYASAAGLPSWQDFEVTGQQSVAPLEWHRHALVVGPLVELRTRRASLPVEFRARVSAAVGLAIVDVHRVTGFPDFATASSFGPSNLRVTPTLDSALELGFSYPAGPLTIGHVITLGTTGLTDMNSGSRAVSAIGGASMYSAFGLILGGAR